MSATMSDLLGFLEENHPNLGHGGFALLANVRNIEIDQPYKLADGLEIRRAHANEANTLRSAIALGQPRMDHFFRNPFETRINMKNQGENVSSFAIDQLPEEKWRYHVIAFDGCDGNLLDFATSTALTTTRIRLGPRIIGSPHGGGPGIAGIFQAYGSLVDNFDKTDDDLLDIKEGDLDEMSVVFERLQGMNQERIPLQETLRQFEHLDRIPTGSPLQFLGYVSILESLLTHPPDPKDPYDSITRQVRQKMLLLQSRCKLPIRYELFGSLVDESNQGTLWTKLYHYRSRIAHGAKPDFKDKLQILKDAPTALEFIRCATVSVMRAALDEPQLVADLRDC